MKKFILIIFLTLLLFPVFSAPNKAQYVSVSNAVVRAKTSQFSNSVGTLEYGEAVTIEKVENGWSNITSSDGKITGWLPNSSLTAKKLLVEVSSKNKTTANAKELALAGKGFDKNFEDTFAEENDVSFDQVDKVESFAATEKDTVVFIKEGHLSAGDQQ